jgi:hypothetical protein
MPQGIKMCVLDQRQNQRHKGVEGDTRILKIKYICSIYQIIHMPQGIKVYLVAIVTVPFERN